MMTVTLESGDRNLVPLCHGSRKKERKANLVPHIPPPTFWEYPLTGFNEKLDSESLHVPVVTVFQKIEWKTEVTSVGVDDLTKVCQTMVVNS